MHNDDTQDLDSLARHVHNPRRDHVHLVYNARRDLRNRCQCKCSRDRNRRT